MLLAPPELEHLLIKIIFYDTNEFKNLLTKESNDYQMISWNLSFGWLNNFSHHQNFFFSIITSSIYYFFQ